MYHCGPPPGFDIGDFSDNLSRKSKFGNVNTYVGVTVPDDIKSP